MVPFWPLTKREAYSVSAADAVTVGIIVLSAPIEPLAVEKPLYS